MGQNQVKKQKKYGEFDVKLDELQLGFEQERKNNFATERSTVVQPLSKSEQPRPLAATRFQVADSTSQKRSVSSEKALLSLKFQQDKKKQKKDDPLIRKMKEINRCQNIADFFMNGVLLQNVNCSLINAVPMNFNIRGCQERQEEATCSVKKQETTQFVDYLKQKTLMEVDRIEKIDFEDMKNISKNFQFGGQENSNDSNQFDIFFQEKNKLQTTIKIERNKPKKQSEISQIISSKKNENSLFNQPIDQASLQRSKYQSNLQQNNNRKQSTFNEFEEVYQELLSDKYQNEKNYDNQDAISSLSNKVKLSQIVKNNNIHSDQVSYNSSIIREKKNPQNYNFKTDLGQKFTSPINVYEMPIHTDYEEEEEKQEPTKRSPSRNAQTQSKFNPLVKQESTPLNAYPDEYTKYPNEQANSNFKISQNNPNNKNYNISQYYGLVNNSENIIKEESVNRIVNQLQQNNQKTGQFNQQSNQLPFENGNVNQNNPEKKNYNISQYQGLIDNSDRIIKDGSEYRIVNQLQNGTSYPKEQEFSQLQNNPQNKNYNISEYQGLVNNSDRIIKEGSEFRAVNQLQNGTSYPKEQTFSQLQNNPQNKNYNISQYQGLVNNSDKIINEGSVHRIVNQLQLDSQKPDQNNQQSITPPHNNVDTGNNNNLQNKNYNISQYHGLINNSDKIINENSVHRIVNQLQNGSSKDTQSQFNPNNKSNNNFQIQASHPPEPQQIQNNTNLSQNVIQGLPQFQIKSSQSPNLLTKKQQTGDIQDFQVVSTNQNTIEKGNQNKNKQTTASYINIKDNNLQSQASIANKGQHMNSLVNGMESQQFQSFQPIQKGTAFKQTPDIKQSNQHDQNLNTIYEQQLQHQAELNNRPYSIQSSNLADDQSRIPIKNNQIIQQTQPPLAQNLDFETESIPKKILKSQNNPQSSDKKSQSTQRDMNQPLDPNLDFEEPVLNIKKSNNSQAALLKSSQASENFSLNFISEKEAKLKIQNENGRKNEDQPSQTFQNTAQKSFPQININYQQSNSHKSSIHSDVNKTNNNNFSSNKANNNFNNNSNTQTQYITPQKTQYSSNYIDSTNIIKNMKDPYSQNLDSTDINENKNYQTVPLNPNQQHLGTTQQPTQFQNNSAYQEQRSRASSTQNLDQPQNYISQNIRFKDQQNSSQANDQRSRANSNHAQDSQFQYSNNFNQISSNKRSQLNTLTPTPLNYDTNNRSDTFNGFKNYNQSSAPNILKTEKNYSGTNNQHFIPSSNNLTQTNNQNTYLAVDNQNQMKDQSQYNPPNSSRTKTDQQKDQGQRKIIQLGGKTYNQPSNQHSQQKVQIMESPYKSIDESNNNQGKNSFLQTQINQNKYYAPNFEKSSPNTVRYTQTVSPTQNVIYYLPEDQRQPNQNKKSQLAPNDKNSIQNLISLRNKSRGSETDSRFQSRNINQQSPEFSKSQSPNLRLNSKQSNVRKFYESKQEQLERFSNSKQSDSSSALRNENLYPQSQDINKFILPKTTIQTNQPIQGNIGTNLSKINKTQYYQTNIDQSSLQSNQQKKMNASQISPSKLTQILLKENHTNFDDSFVNKDYSEYNPTKIVVQSQIPSYSHIKSLIQETQSSNNRLNQQIENISSKSKLNSKGRVYSEERLYSPMNSKISLTTRDYNQYNN